MSTQPSETELEALVNTNTNNDEMIVKIKAVDQSKNKKLLDYISFAAFLLQTSSVVLLIRYSRMKSNTSNGAYATASIIASAEIGKIIVGFLYCLYDYNFNQNKSITKSIQSVYNDIFGDKKVLFLMAVPSLTYAAQNFLMYMSLNLIAPSIYQIVIQLKTATTACFGMCLLSKRYSCQQWISFILLSIGVIIANFSVNKTKVSRQFGFGNIGLLYVLGTTITSGFAGTFMEMQLKGNKNNIFIQNIQLSLFALIGCVINSYLTNDMEQMMLYGYFYGYNKIVWSIVVLNVLGGYFVATVIKRASTMIKTFLSGIAILLIIFESYLFLDDHSIVHNEFSIAVVLVLFANYLYNKEKVKKKQAVYLNQK